MDIDVDIENLTEYLTNSVIMTDNFYKIFLDPTPQYVTFYQYNSNNELVTVTIPNRAMDLGNIKSGSGSPESTVKANVGTLYLDTTTPQLYIKETGEDEHGWVIIPDQTQVEGILEEYAEDKGYVTDEDVEEVVDKYLENYVTYDQVDSIVQTSLESQQVLTISDVTDSYNPSSTSPISGQGVANAGFLTSSDVDQTYSGTSTKAQSGKALKDAGVITSSNMDSIIGGYLSSNNYAKTSDISNATVTFKQEGSTLGSITLNQNGDQTINIAGGGGGGSSIVVVDPYDPTSDNPPSCKALDNAGMVLSSDIGPIVDNYLEDKNFLTTSDVANTYSASSTSPISGQGVANAGFLTSSDVDQTYSGTSTRAQSGVSLKNAGMLVRSDVDEQYSASSSNPQSGKAVAQAIGNITSTLTNYVQKSSIKDTYISSSSDPISGRGVANAGFLTGITGAQVITALGYTPYNSSNPNGYISSVPTATSSAYGTVKFDNSSIALNNNSQIQANGIVEQHNLVTEKFWVGTEDEYNNITTKDENTIYIIKDTES